jgi:FeS assembly protein IscX
MEDDARPLYWEASFDIVLSLMRAYPTIDVETVSLNQLFGWVVALPDFADDPECVTEDILADILREWYEETSC